MPYPELAQINMNDYRGIRNSARGQTRAMVIMHATAFIAVTTAGFLISGVSGATIVVVWWAAALIVGRRLRKTSAQQAPAGPAEQPQASHYADIEDVNDILEDRAQRRNWDLEKRFDIARMACENRTTTFDELERRYDRGLRSVFARARQGLSEEPKNDESD